MLLYLRSQQVVYMGKYLNIGPSHCAFDLFKFEFKIKFVRSRTHLSTIYSNIVCYFFLSLLARSYVCARPIYFIFVLIYATIFIFSHIVQVLRLLYTFT